MTLFEADGFDAVTIPMVADAASVSKMTVTNYFPRKEDLVFDQAEVIVRSLADTVTKRAPGESVLTSIRRDYAERLAADDVTLGPPTVVFARMVAGSHVLTSRYREIEDLREQALGHAIAADGGSADDPVPQIVAAQFASIHRVLFAVATARILDGLPRDEIRQLLGAAATRAFDLLEPSLGSYGIKS